MLHARLLKPLVMVGLPLLFMGCGSRMDKEAKREAQLLREGRIRYDSGSNAVSVSSDETSRGEKIARLTPQQQRALSADPEMLKSDPDAIQQLQKNLMSLIAHDGFKMGFFDPAAAVRGQFPTSDDQILKHVAVWALVPGSGDAWPIASGEAAPAPGIHVRRNAQSASWTIAAQAWDPEPRSRDWNRVMRGDPDYLAQVLANPDSYYEYHLANNLANIVSAYLVYVKEWPEVPSEAFKLLHFGLVEPTINRLLARYPEIRFLKSPDNTSWGLLLQASPTDRILLLQEQKDIMQNSTMTPLGLYPERAAEMARLEEAMAVLQPWEDLAAMPVQRLPIPVVQGSTDSRTTSGGAQ